MGRHVIRAFKGVPVVGFIFFYSMIEIRLKIHLDRGIGIFINGEGCRSVLNKKVQYTCFNGVNFRQLGKDFIGDEMEASGVRPQGYLFLQTHG